MTTDPTTGVRHLRFNLAEWHRAATRANREGRGIAEVAGAFLRAYGAGELDAPSRPDAAYQCAACGVRANDDGHPPAGWGRTRDGRDHCPPCRRTLAHQPTSTTSTPTTGEA